MAGSNINRVAVKKDLNVDLRLPPIPKIPTEVIASMPRQAAYWIAYNESLQLWADQVQQQLVAAISNVSAVHNVPT